MGVGVGLAVGDGFGVGVGVTAGDGVDVDAGVTAVCAVVGVMFVDALFALVSVAGVVSVPISRTIVEIDPTITPNFARRLTGAGASHSFENTGPFAWNTFEPMRNR